MTDVFACPKPPSRVREPKPSKPRSPVARSNPKRRERLFEDAFGSVERVEWIRRSPCVVPGCEGFPCENHHWPTKGAGGKATDISPLCIPHHREFHQLGPETWQRKHGIDLSATNAATEAAWQRRAA